MDEEVQKEIISAVKRSFLAGYSVGIECTEGEKEPDREEYLDKIASLLGGTGGGK